MTSQSKQLKKIYKHLVNAETCTSREEAQQIIHKYEKRLAKLNKIEELNRCLKQQ